MIEKRRTTARIVVDNVRSEIDHGVCSRDRLRPRGSGILFAFWSGARGNNFGEACCKAGAIEPLGTKVAGVMIFSAFLLSSVSECLLTSYFAEVKLLLFSS